MEGYTLVAFDGQRRLTFDRVFAVEVEGRRIRIWQLRNARTNPLPIEVCTFIDRDRNIELERVDEESPLGWAQRRVEEFYDRMPEAA